MPLALDKVPPHDIHAEQSTLGAMLIEPQAIEKVIPRLKPSSFYRPGHDTIFTAAITLHERGEPVDLVTLPRLLEDVGQLVAVGGLPYLISLFEHVPTAANVEYHANIVAQKAALREAHGEFQRLANAALADGADLSVLLTQGQKQIERIAERSPAGKALVASRRKPLAERTIDLADVEPPVDLPLMFGRYLLLGAAHWLTGQTGLGKSTLAYNIACALAEGTPLWGIECEPQRVLYVDMESGDVGRALKVERLYRDTPRVRGGLIFLREPIKLPDELPALLAYVQEKQISLVIFDTARRVFSVKDENDNAEFYNRIAPTLDALKQIGVASLTMGHPSKNGNGSARGAGAQEDAGDVNLSLTLFRGEINDPDCVIALRVTKNRLLGHVPPFYLRRVGEDQFDRVDGDGAGSAGEVVTEATKFEKCQEAILSFLGDQPDNHATYTSILQAMNQQAFSTSTAKRAMEDCKERAFIIKAPHSRFPKGGWVLNDPFADNEAG